MSKIICIVDDEKDLNELMKSYLEKAGYEVRSYFTYEDAIVHAGDADVNLWLLDIMLDEKSGFDLNDEIKARTNDVPVVFISARDKDFDRIIGLEKGSDDYITKPFNMKEMVLRVNNVIRRYYHDETEKRVVNGYVIDEKQRKVSKDNEDILLTTKEFELLMLFVNNKGQAFSRENILSSIWGDNYYGSDRVVDDTLRRLRKKLPDLLINTLHGFGYRLG